MKTFLGIDQSLRKTGLVVLNAAGVILVQRTVVPAQLRDVDRLAFIRSDIQEIISRYQPIQAAMEGYSYNSTGKVFQLGELGGVVKLTLADCALPFIVVPPTNLKKFVSGDAHADKEKLIRITKEKWGHDFIDEDDLCDAHGLARFLCTMAGLGTDIRHELEVIHDWLNPPKKAPGSGKSAKSKIPISL